VARLPLFEKPADYEAFLRVLAEALQPSVALDPTNGRFVVAYWGYLGPTSVTVDTFKRWPRTTPWATPTSSAPRHSFHRSAWGTYFGSFCSAKIG
jgi:hypothetical protein